MNKKITLVLVLVCIIIAGTTCLALTGTVNAPSGLVLRETPSKGANPLTTVDDDAKVEIIEKDGEWYKAKYGIYEGYLFAEYVEVEDEWEAANPEKTATNTENEQVTTNNDGDVKTEKAIKGHLIPSVTSKVILNIEPEKEITLNYEVGNWYNVTYEGKECWIRKNYNNVQIPEETSEEKQEETEQKVEEDETKQEEEGINNEANEQPTETALENKKGYINISYGANVRENASTTANIVTSLGNRTEVTIVAESGDFYKIQYEDITGYVAKFLISEE